MNVELLEDVDDDVDGDGHDDEEEDAGNGDEDRSQFCTMSRSCVSDTYAAVSP